MSKITGCLYGPQKEQRTRHELNDLLSNRSENHRMPPGDSVGRNHHHVDVLTFDYDHDVPSDIVANLDARTGLDPPGNKSGKAWRQALLGIRLYALKQCRIVKEFNSGEKLSPPVQGKHGDNVHKVNCGLKMLSQVGRHLQRSIG
jgi:hypothetical protein